MTNKTWKKWNKEEIELLKTQWVSSDMKTLLESFPNRNYNSLMLKAKQLGIKSQAERKRKGSLDFLDTLTQSSCYWWGFIMSDGHLSPKGELVISLKAEDIPHLDKLSRHLGCTVSIRETINSYTGSKYEMCFLRIQDKNFGLKWLKLLKISSPKTYTPPDLSLFLTRERFADFFAGMIDGDGCIWLTKGWEGIAPVWPNIRMELHGNWKETLELFSQKLLEFYGVKSKINFTKRGTAKIDINRPDDIKALMKNINSKDLLKRKWSKLEAFALQ